MEVLSHEQNQRRKNFATEAAENTETSKALIPSPAQIDRVPSRPLFRSQRKKVAPLEVARPFQKDDSKERALELTTIALPNLRIRR